MTTLLEKAKAHGLSRRARQKATREEIDLALAWVNSEVSLSSVAAAYGIKEANRTGHILYRLATVLRDGVASGMIEITCRNQPD